MERKREGMAERGDGVGARDEGVVVGESRRERGTYRHQTRCLNCRGLVSVFSRPGRI